MNSDLIKKLKEKIDLRDVAAQFLQTKRYQQNTYDQYQSPDREDKKPSLTIYKDSYYDFGNPNNHGDQFDFLKQYAGMNFKEAIAYLSGDQVSTIAPSPTPTKSKAESRPCLDPNAEVQLKEYVSHPNRHQLWYKYRCLEPDTVDHWQLGVGKLPKQKTPRLILPVFSAEKLIGLRGRTFQCNTHPTKWISAKGSRKALFNRDGIQTDGILVINANNIDSILMMQQYPSIGGVPLSAVSPTTGEASWSNDWTQYITTKQPRIVVIIYDNDSAGRRGAAKLQKALEEAGIKVFKWKWTTDSSDRTDLGDLLMSEINLGIDSGLQSFIESALNKVKNHLPANSTSHAHRKAQSQNVYHFKQGIPDILRELIFRIHKLTPKGNRYISDHGNVLCVWESSRLLPRKKSTFIL